MRQDRRHPGLGLAGKVRSALRAFVKARDIVGLSITGGDGADPSAMRVSVRLRRGMRGLDGGGVLALGRRLRAVLGLRPGAGLPILVIGLTDCDPPEEARTSASGGCGPWPLPEVGRRCAERIILHRAKPATRDEMRRSRAPPSPPYRRLAACG